MLFWLLEGEGDGGSDEVEGFPLSAGGVGEDRHGDCCAGELDLVAGQGGQVVKQAAEAAEWVACLVVLA